MDSRVIKHIGAGVMVLIVALGATGVFLDDDPTPVYLTGTVERGQIVSEVTATGNVKAVTTVAVGSQLSGQIVELLADFNDTVKQGQPIAKLDQRSFEARVEEATARLSVAEAQVEVNQASVDRARGALASAEAEIAVLKARTAGAQATFTANNSDLKRKVSLRGRGSVSASDLDRTRGERDLAYADLQGARAAEAAHRETISMARADLAQSAAEVTNAQAQVLQMRAALRQAEIDLERSVIRAPIDGVVIGRDVDRGQTVAASLEAPTLFTIAQDLRQMEVHARIDEADIGRIRSGQSAHFTVDAFPNRSFTGSVVQIRKAAQVVQNVVTYTVVILTENPDLLLLPGMTALVRITVSASGETATIPSAALRYEPSDETVRTSARQAPAVEAGDTATGIAAIVWMLPNDDDRPRPIRVRIGMDDGSAAQLLHGDLESGDALVVGESLPESEGLFSRLRLRL